MLRATDVLAKGDWKGEAADTVVLDFDDRHRRRITMEASSGLSFLLDLPEAVALRTGDAVKLEDGRLVEIIGASEPLSEIRTDNPEHLLRLAWHLGNRHLPVQIAGARLRIRRDHVIAAMVEGLGGKIRGIEAAFDPEGGAYLHSTHGHDHEHHDHEHHDHDHHAHEHHAHEHGEHEHGEHAHPDGCGCGHDHSSGHKHGHEEHAQEKHTQEKHTQEKHTHGEGCGCGHHHDHKHG